MIPAWLTGIGAKLAVVAAVLAIIIGGYLYIGKLQAQNKTLAVEVSQVAAVNKANVAQMTAYQAQVAQSERAEATLSARLQADAGAVARAHAAIRAQAAMTGQDAPVAPVLAGAMDGLRVP